MKWLGWLALALVAVCAGCGEDVCEQATDHFCECVPCLRPTGPSTAVCDDHAACYGECTLDASCDAITGHGDPEASKRYQACIVACDKKFPHPVGR